MPRTMWVKAAQPGLQVPREQSRRKIGAEPIEVDTTDYYHRRIMDGELVEVAAPGTSPATKASGSLGPSSSAKSSSSSEGV